MSRGHIAYEGVTRQVAGKAEWTGQATLHGSALGLPEEWREPRTIAVNTMGDLFFEGIPNMWVLGVFEHMEPAPWHRYRIVTKRSDRLARLAPYLPWRPNIWMGVTVETAEYRFRIDHLRQTGAHLRFLSFEPLLGPLGDLDLTGIHWVIVGGESGRGARPMRPEWVRAIRDQCLAVGIPFFFKQWGGRNRSASGRLLDGRTWDEMPT